MADLRIGVIGYGMRKGLARHAHKPGEGSAIVAACDVRPDRLEQAKTDYGPDIFTTTNIDDLLAQKLDAIFILSPDYLHEEHAIAAMEAGAAVYVEKPMAITTEGCDRMIATAKRTGARLYVGHNMRHMPVITEMHRLIAEGKIGNVKAVWCRHFVGHGGEYYFKDWHAERSKTTSLLLQKGAHDIDVIHWLAGGYSRLVTAMGTTAVYDKVPHDGTAEYLEYNAWTRESLLAAWPPTAQHGLNPKTDVEDLSMMLMTLDNGVLASYQQCHFTPDYWRNYTVIGDAGRLECFGNDSGDHIRVWNTHVLDYSEKADIDIKLADSEGGHGGADPNIVAEFIRYARDGGETVTSIVAAREAVAAGCAGAYSLRNGSVPVTIAPPQA